MFQVLLYLTLKKKKKKGTALLSSSMDANTKEHKQTKSLRLFIIIIIFVNDRKPTLNAHHEFSHKVMKIFFFLLLL